MCYKEGWNSLYVVQRFSTNDLMAYGKFSSCLPRRNLLASRHCYQLVNFVFLQVLWPLTCTWRMNPANSLLERRSYLPAARNRRMVSSLPGTRTVSRCRRQMTESNPQLPERRVDRGAVGWSSETPKPTTPASTAARPPEGDSRSRRLVPPYKFKVGTFLCSGCGIWNSRT